MGDVTVVAPDTNQSAVGHQKTLMRPLRVRERTLADGSLAYSVDGSPTDAVSLAFLGYFGHGFDLVAAGINYGANLGDDITYSGTVSAAMEAVINNCPAFAISQEYYEHPDFALAGRAATTVARNILEHGLSPGELVNVNVPAVDPRASRRLRGDPPRQAGLPGPARSSGTDPRGIPYFWIGGPPPSGLAVAGTDFHAVVNRRIAVTPIHLDLTGRRLLKRLRTWDWTLPDAPDMTEATEAPAAEPGFRRVTDRRTIASGAQPSGGSDDGRHLEDAVAGRSVGVWRSVGVARWHRLGSCGRRRPRRVARKAPGAGLGDAVDSWISKEDNKELEPAALRRGARARHGPEAPSGTGMDVAQLLPMLAAFLPQIVDLLTPDGTVPSGGLNGASSSLPDLGGILGGLLGGR